jgi:predicted transposase YbfD/YdcC
VTYDPGGPPPGRPDVAAVAPVSRERGVGGQNRSTSPYYLASGRGSARARGRHVRGHWGIENGLHRVVDVTFREDGNRTQARNAGANLALVRRIAASLLRRAPGKASIKAKRFQAALDDEFLLQVLQGFQGD